MTEEGSQRDATFLALKIKKGGHKPRNAGGLQKLGMKRKRTAVEHPERNTALPGP